VLSAGAAQHPQAARQMANVTRAVPERARVGRVPEAHAGGRPLRATAALPTAGKVVTASFAMQTTYYPRSIGSLGTYDC